MNWGWLLLGLLIWSLEGGAQVDPTAASPYRVQKEGTWGWTLRPTGVYAAPSTQAVLCTTLLADRPLYLLERLDESEQRQGWRANWYRVQYAPNSTPTQPQEGFIWAGDLALQRLRACNPPLHLSYGLEKISRVQRGDYEEPLLELALVTSQEGKVLHQTTIEAIGTIYTHTQAQWRGNQGVAGIEQILEIAFSDGYCGGVAATLTLLWDGEQWHSLEPLSQGFGDNHFSNAYYKYPKEHQRGSHLIELHQEEGYYNAQQQPVYTKKRVHLYEWTGKQLLKVEGAD